MFDLNIDHYDKNELEDLFDLKSKVYTNDDLERNLVNLKNKIDLDKKIDSQTKERTLNFLLTAKQLLLDTPTNFLTNNIIEQGENFLIQKPPQLAMEESRGVINPVQRKTSEILVNVDSRFRDDQKALSTDFTISFPNLIKNIISMQVLSMEEISGFYNISDKLQNNYIGVDKGAPADVQILKIPDGIYTPETLVTELNTQYVGLTSKVSGFEFVLENGKLIFNNGGAESVSFHPMYYETANGGVNGVNDEESFQDLRLRLAWILGIRSLGGATLGDYIIANGERVTAPTLLQLPRVSYANLVVDDFQNNFYQTVINGTNSHIQNSNIIARIGNVNSEKDGPDVDSPERKYFGPVDVQKLKIQLVDEFGRIVDLNGNELSFSILLKTQYDM